MDTRMEKDFPKAMTQQDEESFFTDEEPSQRDDCYTLQTCLYRSRQGYCEVWQARHNGKWVALKCLRKEYAGNELAEEMLYMEYQKGYPLQHPNIVTMLDFTTVPTLGPCIVEEYVDGSTLAEVIRDGHVDDAGILRIIGQTVEAVGYLHRRQLIHHDLKPANILVTHNGNNVKLIDFGLSRADDDATPRPPAGTLRYVAPEILNGGKADCRSDIYSLGVIIQDFIPLCSKPFQRRLRPIAQRCAASLPDDRYQNTNFLLADLNKRDVSLLHRSWLWIAVVAIVAIVCLVLAIWRLSLSPESSSQPTKTLVESFVKAAPQQVETLTGKNDAASRQETASRQPQKSNANRSPQAKITISNRQGAPVGKQSAAQPATNKADSNRPEVYVDKTDKKVRHLHDYTVTVTRLAIAAYGDITSQTLDSINNEIDRTVGKGTAENIKLRLTMQAVVNQMVSRRK